MYRLAVGIDPGLTGGVALIADGALVAAHSMPVARGGRDDGKNIVDARALFSMLWTLIGTEPAAAGAVVVLERIGVRPGQSAPSVATTGRNYGIVEAVVHLANVPLIYTTPQQWHKALGVPKFDAGMTQPQRKAVTRGVAARLLPGPVLDGIPKSKDGLWEAALVGLYGYRTGRA